MARWLINKHYDGETFSRSLGALKVVSVRLSEAEIDILKTMYPERGVSYAIRTLIHKYISEECNALLQK